MEGILNEIIDQKIAKTEYPNYFLAKNNIFTDMNLVADGFNDFFVGVGLASEIVRNDSRDDLESGDLTQNESILITNR